jgi:hypothetical protein
MHYVIGKNISYFLKLYLKFFLKHNQKVSVIKTPEVLQGIKQYVIGIVKRIYSDEKFLLVENKLCPYYDFLIVCPLTGMWT